MLLITLPAKELLALHREVANEGFLALTSRRLPRHDVRMRRAFGITMMFLAMFSIAGGHWAILQTVAWAQMIRDYSQEGGLVSGVAQTFSGERPCSMCKSIEKNRQKEEKAPASIKVDKKAEVFVASVRSHLKEPLARGYSYRDLPEAVLASRNDPPPTPVPIVLS